MIYVFYALGAFAALIALIVIVALLRPSGFRIARSMTIAATPQMLFPYIDSMQGFQQWNPYKEKDPNTIHELSGPENGPGSTLRWTGNANVGAGIMTIMNHVHDQQVEIDLEFLKPFPGHNVVTFSLQPHGSDTVVTWCMTGRYALIPKIVGLFISMDCMIGTDFENGLKQLKVLSENKSSS